MLFQNKSSKVGGLTSCQGIVGIISDKTLGEKKALNNVIY